MHGFNSVFENTCFIHAVVNLIFVFSVGLCCVTFQNPRLKYWQRIYYWPIINEYQQTKETLVTKGIGRLER